MKKIGLFGFGCVAQGFYEGLKRNPELGAEIKRICVKDGTKKRLAPAHLFTTIPGDIINDPEIDVVVELIDDATAAHEIAHRSFEQKIPVISANKKMIAENLQELIGWQQKFNTTFLYEGAVAGSIPVLQNIEQFFGNQEIKSIRGIVNGSTNYILTKMKNEGVSFDSALKEAQILGFAESDPTLDIDGWDSAYKSILLAYHAFGEVRTIDEVKRIGIRQIPGQLLLESRKENLKLKLVTTIKPGKNGCHIEVAPKIIKKEDALFAIDQEDNAIVIEGSLSGSQTYIGKGAGSHPTGSAVLNDLYLLLNGFRYRNFSKHVLRRSA